MGESRFGQALSYRFSQIELGKSQVTEGVVGFHLGHILSTCMNWSGLPVLGETRKILAAWLESYCRRLDIVRRSS